VHVAKMIGNYWPTTYQQCGTKYNHTINSSTTTDSYPPSFVYQARS